jgi:gliding motility-associated-like protein
MFYAPNAFTPNNDGQNDIWLPSTIGVTKYHLLIHNRWGEVIFETRDPKEPWLGNINEGEHYAADGVYIYHAVIEDLLKLPHEFTGHISVVR